MDTNIQSAAPAPKTDMSEDEKPRTLFIGNIPSNAAKYDIESIFGEIGPLKRIHFQYPKSFNRNAAPESIVGYVTYALSEDAAAAAAKKGGYSFGNNKLTVKLTKTRNIETQQTRPRLPKPPRFQFSQQEPEVPKPKPPRQKPIKKKARLIIRNLSFNVTEDKLKEHFGSYGDLKEINILKKPSGKLVGCAFVQYVKVSQAAKALRDLNSKPFLGRPITIDWAVPKTKFEEGSKQAAEVKEEVEVKEEKPDVDNLEVEIKEEPLSDDEKPPVSNNTVQTKSGPKRKRRKTDSSSDSSDTEDEDVKTSKDKKSKVEEKKPRELNQNDADEGKTLFIRNLNFDTTAATLKEFFEEFGPVNYAVICKDRLTEHSKGTAFIKFRSEKTLTKCLEKYEQDPDHFVADDRQFYMSQAMSRSRLTEKLTSTVQKEPKDKRNLYLVREGFVRPGTPAAEGMSPSDIALRATLHHHKRQMLKDLNNFISDKRLCIHNLPEKFSDKQLRSLVLKHGGPDAKVTEAKVMRDRTKVTQDGFKSKGFGFVTFSEHQHALTALRALNNNPHTFSKHRRPVVEFSLEKKAALKVKEKRLERSKEKLKQIKDQRDEETSRSNRKEKRKRKKVGNVDQDSEETSKTEKSIEEDANVEAQAVPDFGGLVSQAGLSTIPSLKPKGKAARILKVSKPKTRKLLPRRKREKKSQPTKEKGGDDHFEKRLAAYKHKNYGDDDDESSNPKKKKWYT